MGGKTDLPILAMTANIFEDDHKACVDAGMNGFVAKPLEPENLFLEILKSLPKHGAEPGASTIKTADTEAVKQKTQGDEDDILREKLSTIEGMDAAMGLRNMRGDVGGYLRLLSQFDTAHGDDMQKLNEQLEHKEAEEARRIAHTLKGAAGTLGLKTLQAVSGALEDYIRIHYAEQDSENLQSLIDAVIAEQKHFHQALARITETEPENTVASDPKAARKVIKRLVKLLEKDDAAVNFLYQEYEALLKSTFGTVVVQLGQQIEAFDYRLALKTLESSAFGK